MTEENNLQTNEPKIKTDSYRFLGNTTERMVFLVLVTLLSAAPLIFKSGLPAHADWHSHIANAFHFKKCFWQGEFLPRWIESSLYGYGLPKFNYYAPLLYYLFTFIEIFCRNPIISMKVTLVLTIVFCTVSGYIYLKRHGSPISAALVTSFIAFSPAIHIFTYNNNFPTNTLAIPFIFITLYGIDCFDNEKKFDTKSFLITSIGYAGMILSHLATAFIFTLLVIPYFLLSLYVYRSRKFVQNFIFSFGCGIGLSAFYLFPAATETNLVHTEVLSEGVGWDFSKNFMYTLLDRLPSEGYYWGIFDHRYYEMSNALFCLAGLICSVIILSNLDRVKLYFKEPVRANIAITMFFISFIMMTPVSFFVWIMVKQMKTLQFPWRFVSFALPFGSVVMVYAFDLISKFTKDKINESGLKFLSYSIALLFTLLFYVNFVNVFRWEWASEEVFLKHAMNVVWQNREYQPNLSGNPNWKQEDLSKDFSPSVSSSNPNTDITLVKWFSHQRVFQVFSAEAHQIRLRTFYFPGWNAYVDGKPTAISLDPKVGSILIQVPPGKHEVNIKFELTPIRKAATYISIAALLLYLNVFLKTFKKGFAFKNIQKPKEVEVITA